MKKNLCVSLDPDIFDKVQKYSKEMDLPVSVFVNNLLSIAFMDYNLFKKTGLMSIYKLLNDSGVFDFLNKPLIDSFDSSKKRSDCE